MAVIAVPNILRDKFGDAVTQALIDMFNQVEERAKDRSIEVVEERFERRLSEEIGKLRIEMHDMRANIITWMFIFWIGQVGTITAILFAFFRK
mgnify:CR=1 FL=1